MQSVNNWAWLETFKEAMRWLLSFALGFIIYQLTANLTEIPEQIQLGQFVTLNMRVIVQFLLLPLLIRMADKFKHEKKKAQLKGTYTMSNRTKSFGLFPF